MATKTTQERTIDVKIDRVRQELIARAESASSDLVHLANQLSDDPERHINGLGVLQRHAQDIDRLCAELDCWRQARELMVAERN